MIYLNPEFVTTQRDDTFWMWMHRTFESNYTLPSTCMDPEDFLLQYAVLGKPPIEGGTTIALCWELYPEMRRLGLHVPVDNEKIARMLECYHACDLKFVTTRFALEDFPEAEVRPIGVDTDLFRWKYQHRAGAFWCGTDHPMKGHDLAVQWSQANGIPLTSVFKGELPQTELAEVMAKHEFILLSGRLRPLFLVEWEALAAGLKPINVSGVEREFDVEDVADDPRGFVFDMGWSRFQCESMWRRIFAS